MRDKVLGYGWAFEPRWSSNSRRKPRLFDWTDDPAEATADVSVYMGRAILEGVDAPGRKIAWLLESPDISAWQRITPAIERDLDRIVSGYEWLLTCDRAFCEVHPKIAYHPAAANLPWIPEKQYAIYRKSKLCSMFASNKSMVEGHAYRKRVAAQLEDKLDLFGGACGSPRIGGKRTHPDKSEGMIPYMFQVVLENANIDFYYTEKITDCFATGTVPIYWGSTCIGELFDTDGILFFADDFDVDSLSEDLYYEMMPAIRNNFRLVQELEGTDDLLYRKYIRGPLPGEDLGPWIPRQCAAPPEEQAAGGVPWEPWDPDRVAAAQRSVDATAEERLQIVKTAEKTTIRALEQVASDRVSTRKVREHMQPPRAIAQRRPSSQPRITTAFLLHLTDAYIGDNVVFDREHYYSFGRWWLGPTWHYYARTEEVRHIDAGVSIAGWGGDAFQHFVVDALPPLASVIDLLETPALQHVRIVTHDEPAPKGRYQRWFWERLGLTDRIVAKPRNARAGFVIHADLVLFPQFEPNLNQLGHYARCCLRPIQRRLGTLDPADQDLAVYLRRTGLRSVADDQVLIEAVQRALQGSGLQLHILENPSSLEEAEPWIKRAKIVFGPHGGAFANLIFAQPGTHVIEFVPARHLEQGERKERLSMYYGLAQAAGLDYWFVDPIEFDHGAPTIRVDAEQVAATVRRVLKTD